MCDPDLPMEKSGERRISLRGTIMYRIHVMSILLCNCDGVTWVQILLCSINPVSAQSFLSISYVFSILTNNPYVIGIW